MAKSKSRRGSARKVGQSPEIRLVPLPLDVVDHIGGFLEDSPKALGACALTCKLWYAVIRPHIFRRVTVTNRNLNRLKALIRRSPSILFWIRVLRIKGTPYQSRRGLKFRGFDQNETWMYDVLDIFDGEPRKVLSIELLQIEPSGWFHDKLKVFLQKLTTLSFLQSFSLIQCRLPRAVLFGFVRSLPHVTDLHFHNTHCRMPTLASEFPVEELPPSAHPPRLEQLRIHQDTNRGSSDVIDILQIITFTNSYRLLHTLHLHVEDLHTLLVSQAFLRCVGPNLIYLELSLPPLVSRGSRILAYTNGLRKISLETYTKLRTFHLHDISDISKLFIQTERSHLAFPHLEVLIFNMSFSFLRSQDPQNFKNEDHVLFVSPGISNLKKAVIIYTGPLAVSRVKTKVETLFPAFASKVPLEVVKPRNPKVGGPTSD